jgi:DNA-binding winged helix-turn-helix (wHTH) protein
MVAAISRPGGVLSFGPFSLSLAERLLEKADDPVPAGGRALDTLIALTERAGEVVSYRELISIAWPNVTVDEANLRVQIATLRKALGDGEDGARYISTEADATGASRAGLARPAYPQLQNSL